MIQSNLFLLIQLILSISKTTGTILNKEFASTSSASWEYAGRFCFRPNNYPEYSAESNLLISIPYALRNVPLFMAVYWDDATSQRLCEERMECDQSKYVNDKWSNVYHGIPSDSTVVPSCAWRLAVANTRGNLYDLRDLYAPQQQQGQQGQQRNATTRKIPYWGNSIREYHFAVGTCLPEKLCSTTACEYALKEVKISMIATNSYQDINLRHLSSDDYDVMNCCTWIFTMSLILVLATCKSLLAHYNFDTLHWLNVLLFLTEWFTMASYGLAAMYYRDFGDVGMGQISSRRFIVVVHTSSQTFLLLTVLLYTKGWLFGREKISARGRVFISIVTTMFACFTFILSMSSTAGLVVVPEELPLRVAPYAGGSAGFLVTLRIAVALWVLFVIVTTLKRNSESKVARIGGIGIVWLILPCIVNAIVVDTKACSDRSLVITTEAICTLLVIVGLEIALWPFASSVLLLRGRKSVKKANVVISRCIRSGGLTCCTSCCNSKFVWVVGRKPLPEQSRHIKKEISIMSRKIISLTEILKKMRHEETGTTSTTMPERKSFGGGIGGMEGIAKMGNNVLDNDEMERKQHDVWENVNRENSSFVG